MSKEMVISANPHETRVAIMEEGQLCEYYVERQKEFALVGSIYKGRVTRVLPGMQSAFVEIGLDSDAFLYVSDFMEGIEEFDSIVTTVVDKVHKMEDQGGQVFSAEHPTSPALEPADVEAPAEAVASESATEQDSDSQPATLSTASAGPSPAAPAPGNRPPERPRFENRNRRGGRDFGGNRGGRRGRFNRRGGGGGRSGERRPFGRELPPSKYASPRPHEDQSSEQGPAEDYAPIILPGESLAKYREKPPTAAAAPAAPVELDAAPSTARPETSSEAEHEPLSEPQQAPAAPVEERQELREARPVAQGLGEQRPGEQRPGEQRLSEPRFSEHRPAERQPSEHRGFSSGLEPLPGETLSKWKQRESAPPQAAEAIAVPPELRQPEHAEEHVAAEARIAQEEHHEEPHGAGPQIIAEPARVAADLSEEHAATLAAHLDEAESEEEEEEAHRRELAADEAAEVAHDLADTAGREAEAESEGELEQDTEAQASEEEASSQDGEEDSEEFDESFAGQEESEQAAESATGSAGEGTPLAAQDATAPAEQQPSNARVRDDFRARMQNPARRGGRDRGRHNDRGRRPQHGHSHGQGGHRPQSRRPQLIADLLKQGQEIIVQIAKEPLGKKGARITSHVALPGRYLVYMPTLDHTGVSRKIASAEERSRLRHLVNDAKGSAGGGFIVRTAAASAAPEEVRADVEFLTRTWSEIKTRSEQRKAPSLLHRDLNLVERILRDYMNSEFTAVWVDSEEEYTKVVDFMSRFQPQLVNRVKLFTKDTAVFEEFGIQQEIDKGLRPKVWLKSGGYIVINHTEALVAIDVNTGKFVGKGSNRLEDTIVRTNLEAVKEIVRQMRLRDLGGIIVIDFIDMEDRRNREKVMAALEDALRADRAPSKMLRFNEFGLIAITRKRTKQALERTLCQPCPYCTGSGMVKSIPTLCYEIQTEARKMAPETASGSLTLRVHPEISKALKTRESSLIEELEYWTKKSIIIQADPTLHWEQYDIY